MQRIRGSWIRPPLTKELNHDRVRIAKKVLKKVSKYNNRSFANIIAGDETWINFYEPRRKIQNKIWVPKGSQRLFIGKYTMNVKSSVSNFLYKLGSCYSNCHAKG